MYFLSNLLCVSFGIVNEERSVLTVHNSQQLHNLFLPFEIYSGARSSLVSPVP